MRLFNQTKKHIDWSDGAFHYKWEPHGFCDVSDEAYPFIKRQGVPVALAPVPPEEIAAHELQAQLVQARADEIIALKRELELAKAATRAAQQELARAQESETQAIKRADEADIRAMEIADKIELVIKERDAIKAQIGATAKKLADAEQIATSDALANKTEQIKAEQKQGKK